MGPSGQPSLVKLSNLRYSARKGVDVMDEDTLNRRLSVLKALFSNQEQMESLLEIPHGNIERHRATDRIAENLFKAVKSGEFKYNGIDEKSGKNIRWPTPGVELKWTPPERFDYDEKKSLLAEVCQKYHRKRSLASIEIVNLFLKIKTPEEFNEITTLALETGVLVKDEDDEISDNPSWESSIRAYDAYLLAIYRLSK